MRFFRAFNLTLMASCFAFAGMARQSQQPAEIKGKLNRTPVNGIFTQMEGRQYLKGNAARFINAGLVQQLAAILPAAGLNPPVGFEADVNTNISDYHPNMGDKRYLVRLWLNFRNYYKDHKGYAGAYC